MINYLSRAALITSFVLCSQQVCAGVSGVSVVPACIRDVADIVHCYDPQTKSLCLDDTAIEHINDRVFTQIADRWPDLQKLYLAGTRLRTLSPKIGQLQRLTVLDLSGVPLCELPVEIGQLKKLQDLRLSCTHLENLPASIGSLRKLMFLALDHSYLTQLPAEIGRLQRLITLNLAYTDIERLPREFDQIHGLQIVSCIGTPLTQDRDWRGMREPLLHDNPGVWLIS